MRGTNLSVTSLALSNVMGQSALFTTQSNSIFNNIHLQKFSAQFLNIRFFNRLVVQKSQFNHYTNALVIAEGNKNGKATSSLDGLKITNSHINENPDDFKFTSVDTVEVKHCLFFELSITGLSILTCTDVNSVNVFAVCFLNCRHQYFINGNLKNSLSITDTAFNGRNLKDDPIANDQYVNFLQILQSGMPTINYQGINFSGLYFGNNLNLYIALTQMPLDMKFVSFYDITTASFGLISKEMKLQNVALMSEITVTHNTYVFTCQYDLGQTASLSDFYIGSLNIPSATSTAKLFQYPDSYDNINTQNCLYASDLKNIIDLKDIGFTSKDISDMIYNYTLTPFPTLVDQCDIRFIPTPSPSLSVSPTQSPTQSNLGPLPSHTPSINVVAGSVISVVSTAIVFIIAALLMLIVRQCCIRRKYAYLHMEF